MILSLDSNEDLNENGAFKKFTEDLALIDAYSHIHPTSNPPTYLRGQTQLDYMLITPGLLPALQSIVYLPFHTGIFSDHCAIWTDFDPDILFLEEIGSVIEPAMQKLKTSNPTR
eukprot:6181570-Ditylum_brightwellii.AAC.1